MLEFTLGLALFNFVPVLLTGLGLLWLTRLVGRRAPAGALQAGLGGLLIVAGGLSKALWKLLAATTGMDLAWLSNALFPLLGPGFVLLTAALWGRLGPDPVPPADARGRWAAALLPILIAGGAAAWRHWGLELPRGWFQPLLLLTTLGNLTVSLLLIRAALRHRRAWLAGLLLFQLGTIFALPPIAMIEPKTLALHWFEQLLTALGSGAFALGIWRLGKRTDD